MTQIEHIKQIVSLHEQNPELEIVFWVNNEGRGFSSAAHNILKVEIRYWFPFDGNIITNLDAIQDILIDEYYGSCQLNTELVSEKDQEQYVQDRMNHLTRKICVVTHEI